MLPTIESAVDKCHLTLEYPGGQYIDLVLKGWRLLGLYDPGSNVSIISSQLARELGEQFLPYEVTFHQAPVVTGKFVGKLGATRLQLHHKMSITAEGLRVMEAADNKL